MPTFYFCKGWEIVALFPGSGGNKEFAYFSVQDGTSHGGIAQTMLAMADIPFLSPPIPDLRLLMDPFG